MSCKGAVWQWGARIGILAVLLITSSLKLLTHAPAGAMPQGLLHVAAVVELLLALGLIMLPHVMWPCAGVMLLAVSGCVYSLVVPGPCGCTGDIVLDRGQHFLMSATMGFLACVVLIGQPRPTCARSPSSL